jgi:hypothetical protein
MKGTREQIKSREEGDLLWIAFGGKVEALQAAY